jgi:hypothetical protein
LKFLFVYAWGWLADASVCAHQQLGHQEQLDQQQNDRSTPTRWNQSGQERSAPLKIIAIWCLQDNSRSINLRCIIITTQHLYNSVRVGVKPLGSQAK